MNNWSTETVISASAFKDPLFSDPIKTKFIEEIKSLQTCSENE